MSTASALCLFDLDGTLVNSEAGILASIHYAFERIGAALPSRDVLRSWIGPPFQQTFPTVLGDDPARTALAIEKYRERYLDRGWAEHSIYPGIAATIEALAAAGCALGVVTTKPLPQARKIIDALPFGRHFTRVYAPEPHVAHSMKAQMIAQALDDFAVPAAATSMIGDRYFDIEGALANGVRGIGVLWGFGNQDELSRAGAHALANNPTQLGELLLA